MDEKHVRIIIGVGLLVVAGGLLLLVQKPAPETEVHVHADFKVFLDGVDYNFAQEKYMTSEAQVKSLRVHLHGMDGEIIHVHAKGVTLGEFFGSIGMQFNPNCFTLDSNERHCSDKIKTLKFFVNGAQNNMFENYEIRDLDRILVSFGSENGEALQEQLNSVSDRACIFSEKCSERGTSPPESCTINGCIA
ncbi:MAG: hypothetical protein Q8N60_01045 [Candidatus Diapherotrites archaeon]|nr:hypothetical protein [Candidatus Diapherotrites archaeon]